MVIAELPYLPEHNFIMLSLQGCYDADQQVPAPEPRLSGRTAARLVLVLVLIAASVIICATHPGSLVHNASQVAAFVASIVLLLIAGRVRDPK